LQKNVKVFLVVHQGASEVLIQEKNWDQKIKNLSLQTLEDFRLYAYLTWLSHPPHTLLLAIPRAFMDQESSFIWPWSHARKVWMVTSVEFNKCIFFILEKKPEDAIKMRKAVCEEYIFIETISPNQK
jgi:hypothetical protein